MELDESLNILELTASYTATKVEESAQKKILELDKRIRETSSGPLKNKFLENIKRVQTAKIVALKYLNENSYPTINPKEDLDRKKIKTTDSRASGTIRKQINTTSAEGIFGNNVNSRKQHGDNDSAQKKVPNQSKAEPKMEPNSKNTSTSHAKMKTERKSLNGMFRDLSIDRRLDMHLIIMVIGQFFINLLVVTIHDGEFAVIYGDGLYYSELLFAINFSIPIFASFMLYETFKIYNRIKPTFHLYFAMILLIFMWGLILPEIKYYIWEYGESFDGWGYFWQRRGYLPNHIIILFHLINIGWLIVPFFIFKFCKIEPTLNRFKNELTEDRNGKFIPRSSFFFFYFGTIIIVAILSIRILEAIWNP